MPGEQIREPTQQEPWVYEPQPWDSQELHQRLTGEAMAEVSEDEFDVTTVCRGADGELQRTTVHIHFALNTVRIGQDTVPSSHIRYITTKTGQLASGDNIILLSYRTVTTDNSIMTTKYCYILEPDVEKAGKILNKFRYFQFSHVKDLPQSDEKMEVLEYFVPKFICLTKVKVSCSSSRQNVLLHPDPSDQEEKSYIVIIDEECFCLFAQEYDTEPAYQVNFWKDPGPNVVERVAVTHTTQRLEIDTELHQYSMDSQSPNVQEFIKKMRTIKPKPKTCVLDPAEMVKYRHKIQEHQVKRAYEQVVSRERQYCDPSPGPAVQDQEVQYTRDTDAALTESAQLYLRYFKDTLETAYQQGNSNPDWQSMWQPNDQQIQQLLETNLIPEKDARSGGLDPDCVDHFQKSMEDIIDKLFSQDFEGAISSLRSVRKIFSESRYQEIRPILADDDYTLLKKLFFKALSGQPL